MATSKALTRLVSGASMASRVAIRPCGSFLNVEIKRDFIDMAIKRDARVGTTMLKPIELTSNQEIRRHDLDSLKDIVQENDVKKVLVSWPVQDASGPALRSLNSLLNDSYDVVKTSSPFYILDGAGRKMGSICLVKPSKASQHWDSVLGSHKFEDLNATEKVQEYHTMEGTWLNAYSLSRAAYS
jgi:hypothetical protein